MRNHHRLCVLLVLLGGVSLVAATVGPDAAGYSATDVAAYAFVDISRSGVRTLAGTDDATTPAAVGFAFTFYGRSFSSVCISSNGYITFDGCSDAFANQDLGATGTPGNLPLVAPLWADLTFVHPSADAVYYETLGQAPRRQFVVQWNNAYPQNGVQPVTVQLVLYEGANDIRFQYQKVDVGAGDPSSNGASATVGVCDANGRAAGRCLAWSYNAPVLRGGMAILVTPAPLAVTPSQATAKIEAMIAASNLAAATQKELAASLDAAIASFDRGNLVSGYNQLKAFQNKVSAQAGKKIDAALAAKLLSAAQQIIK